MIPEISKNQDFEVETQPSKTYKMQLKTSRISGDADGLEAVKQAVYKILQTERYQYVMYSWDYGVELDSLFGQPTSYAIPEIERRITEALMQDERIESVTDFTFQDQKGVVSASFTVHTIYGDFRDKKEVKL